MNRYHILYGGVALAVLLVMAVGLAQAQGPSPEEGNIPQDALGTAFTYQGQLRLDDEPVSGTCELDFGLYDAASLGSQIGFTQTVTRTLTDGLFTAELDFGPAFAGTARWLGVGVRCGGEVSTMYLGRQALTATPYALFALGADWDGLTDVPPGLSDGDDDTTYASGFGLDLVGTTFNVVTATIQQRIAQACAPGSAIRQIDGDGTVLCEDDSDTTYSAGDGLALAGTVFSITTPYQLPQTCASGQVAEWNGSTGAWECGDHYRLREASNGVLDNEYDTSWDIAAPNVIPDLGTTAVALDISDSGSLLDLQVRATVAHPHSHTLGIVLKYTAPGEPSPTTEITLQSESGECPTLPEPAYCEDPPSDPYCEATSYVWPTVDQPVSGSLDDFLGLDPTGDWELWVTDTCETYPGADPEGTQYITEFGVDTTILSDAKVTVNGDLLMNGSISIGTTNPTSPLHVVGDGKIQWLEVERVHGGAQAQMFFSSMETVPSPSTPVNIPDGFIPGVEDVIAIPDLGPAQELVVSVDISNSDISWLEVRLTDPNNNPYVLWCGASVGFPQCTGAGHDTELATSYPDPTPTVSGDLSTWIGQNPQGSWTLKVVDYRWEDEGSFDGQINDWDIRILTEAGDTVHIWQGSLVVDNAIGIGTTDPQSALHVANGYIQLPTISGGTPPAADCDAAGEAGRMIVRTDGPPDLYICDGSAWIGK